MNKIQKSPQLGHRLMLGLSLYLVALMLPIIWLCMQKFKKYYAAGQQPAKPVVTGQKIWTWEFFAVVGIWVTFGILSGLGVI